jgi:vitamin B12 transporter
MEIVGGINAERSNYLASSQFTTDALRSIYLNSVMHPLKDLEFTLGGRGDHYDTVGDSVTWRTGAAYLLNDKTTKLHATYGTGFNAPDPVFVLGQTPFFLPNPGIKPEQSRGWDAGIDQDLFDHKATVGITYFNNNIHNLFTYDFEGVSGQEVNESRAETQGVEVETTAKLGDRTQLRVSYTYLSGGDPDTQTPLNLLPRHTIDGEIRVQATQSWLVGVGVHGVIDRVFVNFGSTTGTPIEDYSTVRLFTSYEATKGLLLKLRVENALNDKYEENPGWPALPFGIFGSVEWRF